MPAYVEDVFPLIGSIDSIDAIVLVLKHTVVEEIHVAICHVGNEARSKLHNLVQIFSVELAFQVSETVINLNGALAVSDEENLVEPSLVFDHSNVVRSIVKAHLGESEHPVVVIGGRIILT